MALAGPRLDRPSAIGDEGRPRGVSLGIASLVIAGIVGISGALLEWPSLLPFLATFVGATATGVALLNRNTFIEQCAGHIMLVVFGGLLVLLAIVAPFVNWVGLALGGFILALFGITITWADVGDRDGLKRATKASGLSYVAMWGWLVVLSMVAIGLWLTWAVLSALTETSSPGAAITGFLFVVCYSAIAVRLSLRWLPIQELAPRDRRPAIEERLAVIKGATLMTAIVSVAAGSLAIVALLLGWFTELTLRSQLLADVFVAFSSRWIIGPIVVVGTLSLLAGALAVMLRRLTRSTDVTSTRRVSAGVAGLALLLLLLVSFVVTAVAPRIGLLIGLSTITGPLLLTIVLAIGLAGMNVGLLPDRAGGPAIAAAGLVLAAVGFVNGPSVLVFACVAGAVLVWDVSSFGLGLTAELGHLPETRRLELFHALIALGIAVVATLVVVVLDLLRTSVFAGIGGTLALLVLALGALILLIPLRG
jgi:hypothetical protein